MSINRLLKGNNDPLEISLKEVESITMITAQLQVNTIQPPLLGGVVCHGDTCIEGDLLIECLDNTDINYRPPNFGTNGQVLSSNGDGSVQFIDSGTAGLTSRVDTLENKTINQSVALGITTFAGDTIINNLKIQNVDNSYTLIKNSDNGTAGYALKTDGLGNTYWSPDNTSGSGGIGYAGTGIDANNKLVFFGSNDGLSAKDGNVIYDGINIDMTNGVISNVGNPIQNGDAVNYQTVLEVQSTMESYTDNAVGALELQTLYDNNNLVVIDTTAALPLILKSADNLSTDEILIIKDSFDNESITLKQNGQLNATNSIFCPNYQSLSGPVILNGNTQTFLNVGGLQRFSADNLYTIINNEEAITLSTKHIYNEMDDPSSFLLTSVEGVSKQYIDTTTTTFENININIDELSLCKVKIGGDTKIQINNSEIALFGDQVVEKPNLLYEVQVAFDSKITCDTSSTTIRNYDIITDAAGTIYDKIGGQQKGLINNQYTILSNTNIEENFNDTYILRRNFIPVIQSNSVETIINAPNEITLKPDASFGIVKIEVNGGLKYFSNTASSLIQNGEVSINATGSGVSLKVLDIIKEEITPFYTQRQNNLIIDKPDSSYLLQISNIDKFNCTDSSSNFKNTTHNFNSNNSDNSSFFVVNNVTQDTRRSSYLNYVRQNWTNVTGNYVVPSLGLFTTLDFSLGVGETAVYNVISKNITLSPNNTDFVVTDPGIYKISFSFNFKASASALFAIQCITNSNVILGRRVHETLNNVSFETTINALVALNESDFIQFQYGGSNVGLNLIDKEISVVIERIIDQ